MQSELHPQLSEDRIHFPTSEKYINTKSSPKDSPASRSNLTYKSHRKSVKPVMVDRSQQYTNESNHDYRDHTFMEVQEQSLPNS